jgi:hypothetical protein
MIGQKHARNQNGNCLVAAGAGTITQGPQISWRKTMSVVQAAPTPVLMFPLDIERLIFEQAARDDTRTALNLVLVCRSIQSWSVDWVVVL